MSDAPNPERRRWLTRGLLGFIFAAGGGMLLDVWRAAGRFTSDRWIEVASATDVKASGRYPFPAQKVVLFREGNRFAALSLECTHLGCLLNATDQGFYCPCHGSEFGPRGTVYSGPASEDLPWHAARLEQGRVWIHSGQKLRKPVWVTL